MQVTKEILSLFKFSVGEGVYLKQDVINDQTRHIVNGKEIDKILLQHVHIVVSMGLEIVDEDSYVTTYSARPGGFRAMAKDVSINTFLTGRGHELCNKAEAVAILRLKDSA